MPQVTESTTECDYVESKKYWRNKATCSVLLQMTVPKQLSSSPPPPNAKNLAFHCFRGLSILSLNRRLGSRVLAQPVSMIISTCLPLRLSFYFAVLRRSTDPNFWHFPKKKKKKLVTTFLSHFMSHRSFGS